MVNRAWRIIPRPLMETVLNNHAQYHRVPQPLLLLNGPRDVGKTTLILERVVGQWNNGAHVTCHKAMQEGLGQVAIAIAHDGLLFKLCL